MIGTSVDRYKIVEELGHGGMSVVYRGIDSALERDVAVKVLHNHLAKKAENRQRFHREAKAIARLRHPNILEIYDFSSADAERSYIVMEYVEGENLRQYVARTGHPPPEVAALICMEIADALEHAHDHGIIHRDLKPENVMVSSGGLLKLMDFGIAHVIDAETMTATGSLMGSPAHMAPEIIDGKRADVRADVFALGTVLYWLATGRLPFEGNNAPQVLRKVLEGDCEDPESVDPRTGQQLGAIIRRCLATDPDDRFESVLAVRRELAEFVAPMGWTDFELELKKYFLDPDGFRGAFEATIVDLLTQQARAAQRRRDIPEAIALFNRILAYDPENSEVKRLLDSLCRRASVRRVLPWVAVAAIAAIGATALAVSSWNEREREAQRAANAAPVVAMPVDEITAAVQASQRRARLANEEAQSLGRQAATVLASRAVETVEARPVEPPEGTVVLRPLEPQRVIATPLQPTAPQADAGTDEPEQKPEPPVKHLYRFSVVPAGANFYVDGQQVEVMRARAGIELTEGMHILTASSTGARRWGHRLQVTGPQAPENTPMPIVLTYEPATVTVVSNVSAVVWFEDRPMRPIEAQGRNATFSVPFGSADSTDSVRKKVNLKVASAMDMARPKQQTITVTPGQSASVNFNFESIP